MNKVIQLYSFKSFCFSVGCPNAIIPIGLNFSDYIVRNEEDLITLLEELRKEID
jgi:hypothetical protein